MDKGRNNITTNIYLSHRMIHSFPRYHDENYKIKTSFVSPEGPKPKAQADKTCTIDFKIFISTFVKCLQYDVMHDFSVWLRTGSNLADMNSFRSHTGNYFIKSTTANQLYNNL